MDLTCPALTWSRKNGLYGTRRREAGCVASELKKTLKVRSRSAKTIHQRYGRRRDCFGGVLPGTGGGLSPSRRSPRVSVIAARGRSSREIKTTPVVPPTLTRLGQSWAASPDRSTTSPHWRQTAKPASDGTARAPQLEQ